MELAIINGTFRNGAAGQTSNTQQQQLAAAAAALTGNKAGFLRRFFGDTN